MIKRILIAVFFIILLIPSLLVQIPFEVIKWIITGKEIGDPWIIKLFIHL